MADQETETLENVVARYETPLLRYACRLLNNSAAAQDVVQETFIKLARAWTDGARPAKELGSWLYRVTHNHAVDHIRSESRLRVLHEAHAEEREEPPAPPDRKLAESDAMQAALKMLRHLEPDEQQVVILRLQEGKSYKEIAEITRRTEGGVASTLHYAVKKLSQRLKQAGAL